MKIIWAVWIAFYFPSVLSENKKPHIITILVDDLGWNDLGHHGSDQIRTPNIDALAYSGMILSHHYVLPSCTPSRSALLTGFYPIRSGLQGFPLRGGENRNLPLSFKLKPAHLKDLGYKTHMVGKWHLGYQTYNHVPNNRGFDTFFGYYNGYVDYHKYYYNQSLEGYKSSDSFYGYDMHYNDDVYWTNDTVYATRVFTRKAQKVIRDHNPSEPLYLYLSHLATHTGNDDFMGMEVPEDIDVNKTYSHIKDYGRRMFAGCLEELDTSIGIVIEELKNKDMLENSIIVVMSDNGAHTVSVDMAPNWSSNWPLAGTKFTMFEGGVRGAALIWSPLLPKGFVNDGFLHITDWLPTLYSAAGGDVKNLGPIDGRNQWEAFKSRRTVTKDNFLINIDDRIKAEGIIINDRWKIIKGGFPTYGLYDLHWGKEENASPNPEYDLNGIMNSQAANAIKTVSGYENIFEPKRMLKLRKKTKLDCEATDQSHHHIDGYINQSSEIRCPDFCVFDLRNDPCELVNLKNKELIRIGIRHLEDYKKKMILQKFTFVDPKSNPAKFGGAWMPWDFKVCAKSLAKEFTSQYLHVSLLITFSWYSIHRKKN